MELVLCMKQRMLIATRQKIALNRIHSSKLHVITWDV